MTTELYDEGAHWFDVTLAEGVDSGRYRLVVESGRPTRMVAGPNFHTITPDSWMAEQIDRLIDKPTEESDR